MQPSSPQVNPLPDIDLDFLRACLLETGQVALAQRGQMQFEVKADFTPVTVVDKQVETLLIEKIGQRYPGHVILSEESGLHPASAEFAWVIDPIDGTRAFASGLPIWGVSIGIFRRGQPYAGGFYMPVTREMYWGTTTQAFYNDQQLQPAQLTDLESTLLFLGVPSNFHLYFKIAYPRIRSLGSTAAHLAYVSTGASVGALTRFVSLWDLAGILPMMAALGVEIAYLDGQPFDAQALMDGRPIRSPLLIAYPQAVEYLRKGITTTK